MRRVPSGAERRRAGVEAGGRGGPDRQVANAGSGMAVTGLGPARGFGRDRVGSAERDAVDGMGAVRRHMQAKVALWNRLSRGLEGRSGPRGAARQGMPETGYPGRHEAGMGKDQRDRDGERAREPQRRRGGRAGSRGGCGLVGHGCVPDAILVPR